MTSSHVHAVIWIDHHQARVFHFRMGEEEGDRFYPQNASVHLHHRANGNGSGHEEMEPAFIRETMSAVSGAGEILVIGPGSSKTEFVSLIEKHDPKLRARIFGVETVDHPSDDQIVAYARRFFRPADGALSH